MADEGDGLVLVVHRGAQHIEEVLGLRRSEDRRWLVENDDVGVASQALDDLDPLSHPGRQVGDPGIGVDPEPVALADLDHPPPSRPPVQRSAFAEDDVLPDAKGLDQAEVLMDHPDPVPGCVVGIADDLPLAVDEYRAGISGNQPDQDLHQGGLAGAVLAEDAMDTAVVQAQVHVVAGHDGAEALRDALEMDGGNRPGAGSRRFHHFAHCRG